MKPSLLACIVTGTLTGCFSAELDPNAAGAFACGRAVDDAPCPEGQACSAGRCQLSETLPVVTISGPVDGEVQTFIPGGPDLKPVVAFSISEGFELVNAEENATHVFGQGHAAIYVDGQKLAIVSEGSAAGSREVTVTLPNTVGAHRISVELVRNDGVHYDHPEAVDRHLFWLSDGTPRVAVADPWPGQVFSLDKQAIDVRVGVVDFEIVPTGLDPEFRRGHAHVHYDAPFPACEDDPLCAPNYFVVTDTAFNDDPAFGVPNPDSVAQLPAADEPGEATITPVLRNINHTAYRLPDGTPDDENFPPTTGDLVFNTITIVRE